VVVDNACRDGLLCKFQCTRDVAAPCEFVLVVSVPEALDEQRVESMIDSAVCKKHAGAVVACVFLRDFRIFARHLRGVSDLHW